MADEPTVNGLIVGSLNRLETAVTALDVKLDGKVDKADLSELRGELRSHHDRIAKLEESERSREVAERTERQAASDAAEKAQAKRDRKSRRTTLLLSLVGTVAFIASTLAAFGVHL